MHQLFPGFKPTPEWGSWSDGWNSNYLACFPFPKCRPWIYQWHHRWLSAKISQLVDWNSPFFFLRCRVSFTVFAHTCTLWKAELAAAHRFLCLPWRIQPASRSRAELHCLSDNAWLTWSTSEPDILLSLHHNATTQTDMAALLISRAGFTDLLCAHCDATWFL